MEMGRFDFRLEIKQEEKRTGKLVNRTNVRVRSANVGEDSGHSESRRATARMLV